jgi:enoyl-CoA hydratase/carnithine racemase
VSAADATPEPRPDAGWQDSLVKLETRGRVAIAWLDHPPANALSPDTIAALRRVWDTAAAADARVFVVASANARLFCAGADIKAFTAMDDASGRAYVAGTHELLRAFERSAIVTLAAVNGLALGGGCELAMACDLRIAASSARFGQPEIKLGIIPGFGGTQRLARLVGPAKALELNLVGDPIGADEAERAGLVNRVVADDELLPQTLALAETLAAQAPLAVAAIKRISAHPDLDEGIAAEQSAFVDVFASADAREGIAAFLEKRAPSFQGR